MPQGFAARLGDPVMHPLPLVLGPGPGSHTCMIGGKPAWRGVPLAAVAALQTAATAAQIAIKAAVAATAAAAGPAMPAAYAAQQTLETTLASSLGPGIQAAASAAPMADIHLCTTPSTPAVPDGPGVVITGSATVQIDFLPACRMGDTILEAIGPANKITMGCPNVTIGG
jgi:uncharacterized Zn-binding protein involved in type VI secretion